MLDVLDVFTTQYWKVAQVILKSIMRDVIKLIYKLYQRHYQTWSLHIFIFLYIIRDTTVLFEGNSKKNGVRFYFHMFFSFCVAGPLSFMNKYFNLTEKRFVFNLIIWKNAVRNPYLLHVIVVLIELWNYKYIYFIIKTWKIII